MKLHVVSQAPRRRRRFVLFAAIAALLPIWLIVAVFWACRLHINRHPELDTLLSFEPPTTGAVYDARGQRLIELAHENREIVTYDQIPEVLRQAILATEDRRFFEHQGVDYSAWPRVAARNLQSFVAAVRRSVHGGGFHWAFVQGGSTLTQQLVRGYCLSDLTRRENEGKLLNDSLPARSLAAVAGTRVTNKLLRKIEEIRLALWLEDELTKRLGSQRLAKETIFARYASFVYLGNGRYGFAAASRYYFGKPLSSWSEQDTDKAALLAALIKKPNDYNNANGDLERVRARRNDSLALMAKNGFISVAAAQRWQVTQLPPIEASEPIIEAPGAVAHALDVLRNGVGGFGLDDLVLGRVHVRTTVDLDIQRIASEALENGLNAFEKRRPKLRGLTQGAVVVLRNSDASILAEIGGRRFYQGSEKRYTDFNRAFQAQRQPGSALKPLVYLTAFRNGANLDTPVLDEPIEVPDKSAHDVKLIANYDGSFKGWISMREALAESRNAATMHIASAMGIEPVLATARDLGMTAHLQPVLSTALGASEVTLVELANLYRTLATGVVAPPHIVHSLINANGDVIHRRRPLARRIFIPELPLIQEGLRGVIRMPGGTAHALAARSFPLQVLGKTGTSNEFRDALFVGATYGTDGITVAVWIGRDDNKPLGNGEAGGRVALPVFREIMTEVYKRNLVGPPPRLPSSFDAHIDAYLMQASLRLPSGDETMPEGSMPPPDVRNIKFSGSDEEDLSVPSAIPAVDGGAWFKTDSGISAVSERDTKRGWVCFDTQEGRACVAGR